MSLNNFLVAQVSDPTDFTSSSALQRMDSYLRCNICKEFYDGPVMTSCGHTFCSLCIRDALSIKQECPLCRAKISEGQLRSNVALEDIVTVWRQEARCELLTQYGPPKSKRANQKRKAPSPEVQVEAGPSHRPDASPVKRRKAEKETDGNATVPCPACENLVRMEKLNDHLDSSCKKHFAGDQKTVKTQWSKVMGSSKSGKSKLDPNLDYLPKVAYDTLKDKQLKDLLAPDLLPTTGDRASLVQRHQRWVMIYNANLDKAPQNRSSKLELRTSLNKWESGLKTKPKKPVVEDSVAYQKSHTADFRRLISQARGSKNRVNGGLDGEIIVVDSDP